MYSRVDYTSCGNTRPSLFSRPRRCCHRSERRGDRQLLYLVSDKFFYKKAQTVRLTMAMANNWRRSLIWQDMLVSLWYGRPSCITVLDDISLEIPAQESSRQYPFTHSCNRLFTTANKTIQATNRAKFSKRQLSLLEIRDFKKAVDQIVARSAPYLQHASTYRNRDDSI